MVCFVCVVLCLCSVFNVCVLVCDLLCDVFGVLLCLFGVCVFVCGSFV